MLPQPTIPAKESVPMLPLLLLVASAGPPGPPSPLRLIPDRAEALLLIPSPRVLAENVVGHRFFAKLLESPVIKEQLDSTNIRRARQLLAYFERSLGGRWPALLDDIAGGGIAVGAKLGNNQPAVLVIQGRDEKKLALFLAKALEAFDIKAQKGDYHGIPTWAVGDGLFIARTGAAIVASNKKESLRAALDLARGKGKSLAGHPDIPQAEQLTPANSLARLWFNMRPVHASPEGKRAYAEPREDIIQTYLFGSYLSVLGRTPFVAGALVPQEKGFRVTFRAPRGTDGMGSDRLLHVLPEGQTLRPPLQPEGALYGLSFAFDFASIWNHRGKLFNPQQLKGLEQADKSTAIAGAKLSTLLTNAGAAHRFVIVEQPKAGYRKQPATLIPAFAFVAGLRDGDKFAPAMDAVLRTGGLFLSNQLKMVRKEETVGDLTIAGYRFSEKEPVDNDRGGFRYNFSPCWVRVKDQFVFSTTFELASALVPMLQDEKPASRELLHHRAIDRVYPDGFARLIKSQEDVLVTQTILDQAVPPAEALKQVRAFAALVKSMGGAGTASYIGKKEWRFDIWLNVE
jgi:hypothetical protein